MAEMADNDLIAEVVVAKAKAEQQTKEQNELVTDTYKENEKVEDGEVYENMNIKDLGRFRQDPIGYVKKLSEETSAFYQGKGWRSYDNYIGSKLFVPGSTEEIKKQVLNNENVQQVVMEMVLKIENGEEIDKKYIKSGKIQQLLKIKDGVKRKKVIKDLLNNKVMTILNKMCADMTSFNLKALSYVLNLVFTRMYHQGVYINEAQFQKIRQVAITAAEKKIPIIVLPCHKSHIDYLVISYIFVRLGLAVPYIAAGDNLDLPVIGTILRRGGAFYIRRSWTDDKLYGLVATEYIHEVLAKGHNMEVFIEGTRSRTGKLLNPKFGILNIILDGLLNQKYKDCLILPISIGYDRVIETSSYVNELLGIPKEKESLMGILSSSNIIQLKWGRVDIRFSDPFFLKEFIDIEMVKRKDDNPVIDNKIILRALGYRVMSDINNTSVVMPTALVGTVLLTLRGRGVGFIELIRRVEWLITHILLKGGRVAHFGDMKLDDVVLKAIKIIKDLIGTRVGLVEPVYFAINRFELSFYRNQVIHIFISEAIVSVAMYTIIKKGGSKLDQRIPFDKLLQDCIFLSKLLKWEFVYPPGNIKDNLLSTIDFLEKSKVINFDGENVELSDNERNSGRENYDFYCFLIWPFVESYWLSTVSVFTILSNQNSTNTSISYIEENEFKNKIQQLGKTLYYEGDLSYLEAINKETINNGFKFLVENEVLMKKNNFVYVNQEYLNNNQEDLSNSKLWQLVDTIGKFRREGKNRRDNQTVSSRVLRLAELVGKNGWNNTKLATAKNSTNPPKL